jgi:hypothetical protein
MAPVCAAKSPVTAPVCAAKSLSRRAELFASRLEANQQYLETDLDAILAQKKKSAAIDVPATEEDSQNGAETDIW